MNITNVPRLFASRVSILRAGLWGFLIPLAVVLASPVARADIHVEAYTGQPMGVGRVMIDLPSDGEASPLGDDRFTISDTAGRVLYPAPKQKKSRKILRRVLGIRTRERVTFYFLFLGDEPLELEVFAPERIQLTVTPKQDAEDHAELLDDWWKSYAALYERIHRQAEYPVGVQTYLTAMWAERLGKQMPQLEGFLLRDREQGGTVVGKLTADEAYRASVLRDLMGGRMDDSGEMAALPAPAIRVAAAIQPTEEVVIEPIAAHVPEECFYVRFGTFTNYLWFRNFTKQWNGDLANMLVNRSIRRDTSGRISAQLGLKESQLAAILGPQIIDDVAIIGMDPYVSDGAAIGVLFKAKNNFLLTTDFNRKQAAAVKLHDGATQEQLEIAGHKVSFASSPDGVLRSYYVVDGDYHLVTTSRRIVERFLEAGSGDRPLSAAADFQVARQLAPTTRGDQVFLHLSQAFLQQLTSPAYRIELDRRIRSIESSKALTLAHLAAAQEGIAGETVGELIQGGLLPASFESRSDDATWIADEQGRPVESVRGYPGRFVPIADHLPTECSLAERARYAAFAQAMESEVGSLVPLTACLHRELIIEGERERIAIELHLQRYSESNLAPFAKKLGPAEPLRVAPIDGDIASFEVVLDGMLGGGEPFHLFGGLRDGHVPLAIHGGALSLARSLPDALEGYLGAWPRPEMLERFLGRPRGPYDANGFAQTGGLFDLWVHRADDFLLFSFKRNVLAEVGHQLAMVDAPPAQGRLWIADLVGTPYQEAATAFGYARARQTSASGSRFMNSLTRQLHVDKQSAAELANQLVGGEFACPLGGEYLLVEVPGGVQAWASTAAAPNNQFLLTEIPPDYQLPLLTWFRGMTAKLTRGDDSLTVRAVVEMGPKSAKTQAKGTAHEEAPAPKGAERVKNGEELPVPAP